MRICLDLDGVICTLRKEEQTYAEVSLIPGAKEWIQSARAAGHEIIISAARHMKTKQGNEGKVLASQGLVTLQWLHDHGVEFDEIHFGKPWADIYIDDNALRFSSWNDHALTTYVEVTPP